MVSFFIVIHPKKEATHLDHFLFHSIRLCMAEHFTRACPQSCKSLLARTLILFHGLRGDGNDLFSVSRYSLSLGEGLG